MDTDSLGCPDCDISLDERQLVTTTKVSTISRCPQCGKTLSTHERSSGTNLAALIVGEIAAIDSWLDSYAAETSHQVVKRDVDNDQGFLWSIGTEYAFACECYYDQNHTGFVGIRMVTKKQADAVWQRPNDFVELAAKLRLQTFGIRRSGTGDTDAKWGVVQYVSVETLNSPLLKSVTQKLSDAMQLATTELLGGTGSIKTQHHGEKTMATNYDPDDKPEVSEEMIAHARDRGYQIVNVICDEEGAQVGDNTGVSFLVATPFLPNPGDLIELQDGTICEVKRTDFRVFKDDGHSCLGPNVFAQAIGKRTDS